MEWNLCLAGAYSQASEVGATCAAGEANGPSEGAGKAVDIELAAAYAFPWLSQHDLGHSSGR